MSQYGRSHILLYSPGSDLLTYEHSLSTCSYQIYMCFALEIRIKTFALLKKAFGDCSKKHCKFSSSLGTMEVIRVDFYNKHPSIS